MFSGSSVFRFLQGEGPIKFKTGVYILENTPPPGGGGKKYGLRARGGKKYGNNNANGKKRERKEGDKTVISHKITHWGKYKLFFPPQLGQRKKTVLLIGKNRKFFINAEAQAKQSESDPLLCLSGLVVDPAR